MLQENYDLMPWPKEITEKPAKFLVNSDVTISINAEDKKHRVRNAAVSFLRRLSNRTGVFLKEGFPVFNKEGSIIISFDNVAQLNVNNNESYTLEVNDSSIIIKAKTDVGAIRGLATLLQLTKNDTTDYYFPGIYIDDTPRFVWRGLMIDVSRHFQPINVLKRNLDAMASVKMNVFHWHLTDDQGFRIESKIYPKLQEYASDGQYYTHEQIKDVVAYANNLGIRVIPEIDVPGHASALLTAYPELGSKKSFSYAIERNAGVFDPTLDPTNEKTYEFLKNLFTEIAPLFPDDYFHIGGDENEGKHWNENETIQAFKIEHGLETNHDLQTYFNIRLEKILNKLGKKLMGWDEILTPSTPTTSVIHSWRGEHEGLEQSTLIEAAQKGYQAVLSAGYYIDRMLPIEHHYTVDPIADAVLSKEERKRILGAEATMWSELVTPTTIDSRIWPRTAAIAERFWSPKDIKDVGFMKKRLKKVSFNLEELGLTHIKNRDVILRNMTNNQDISSLITLSKICEPLKVYERNKDGIEYKSYSPFVLFADACVVDAEDAEIFNDLTSKFIDQPKKVFDVLYYLKLWANNHNTFSMVDKNPKLNPLKDLSKSLSSASQILFNSLESQALSTTDLNNLKNSLVILEQPHVDIEVVITKSLRLLTKYCETNYLK
ncbi:family 20 glycosylhydrolase [Seonamhaeicola sp. MEBiC1930]|uniref:beta-N-acetylhexosaminidase n=1 Tax=Seonamhaeicola sp. MEBiC01930 TaxID=2976768 RepID=UPI0032532A84